MACGAILRLMDDAGNKQTLSQQPAPGGCEVMFYHLLRQPLEQVLPVLLHKTLERKLRALVRCGNPLRIRPLSDAIWTWRDEAFIAHGTPEDGHMQRQPVLLMPDSHETAEDETDADTAFDESCANSHSAPCPAPNGADILFCVEGAQPRDEDLAHFSRICVLFTDADAAAKEQARALWRRLKERDDLRLTYWQQDAHGRWERKA